MIEEYKFYRVEDIMKILSVKESKAYQIIQKLNKELEGKGKITIAGRVSAKYFDERFYY